MSLRRPEAPGRKLPCDRQNAIFDLTINNQSIDALQNQFSRILFQQDGADRAILEHDHTAPNQGAFKILGAAGREDLSIDYQTGAINIGAAGTLTLNLPIVSNPDDFQVGTLSPDPLPQLWYKETSGVFRIGSATGIGDASDVASNGIRIYSQNAAGDPMDANNYAEHLLGNGTFRIIDTDAGTAVNVFRVNNTRLAVQRTTATGTELDFSDPGLTIGTGNGAEIQTVFLANFANLDFANDAGAAAGGVALGGIYHNSGALRVRIV